MFSIDSLTRVAKDAISWMASSLNVSLMPSVSSSAVVDVDRQVGSESFRFALPVADHGHGAHQQRGRGMRLPLDPASGAAFGQEQREELDRLAQTHVVGQARAHSHSVEEGQPGQPALLVRAKRTPEPLGGGHGLRPPVG